MLAGEAANQGLVSFTCFHVLEGKIFAPFASCSEANGRNANKIVLYEDAAKKQLQEFISTLRGCEAMLAACSSLDSILNYTDAELLQNLLVPGNCELNSKI